jgi:tetratricopeptide (TPR) repeat protein
MFARKSASLVAKPLLFCLVGVGVAAIGLAASCSKPSADDHVRKAQAYVGQSQLSDAIFEYRLALESEPKRGDIRVKLADAYLKSGDAPNAMREYVRAADLLPTDVAAQLRAGNVLLVSRAFEDAKARANKVLALDPKNADAQILLGNAQAGLKDLDGALADYQESLALNPTQDSAYIDIGTIQFMRGERDQAEASFKSAIAAEPKSVAARMALANFLWASGRAPEAERALKDALTLDPSNLTANRALGVFYLASNRAPDAEPYFKKIADTAKTPAATIALADYYVHVRRFDDAKRLLTDLAQKPANYAAATTRLAAIDATQGQRAQGLVRLKDVLDKYPKDAPARLLTARLLLVEGKRDDALANATTIVTNDPNAPAASDAYLLIGRIQASLDRTDDAIKAYEEVLKRQARPLAADLALASLYFDQRALDKATTYVHQARTIAPRNPVTRALTVRILLAQHDMTKASEELASLRRDFPNSPTVLDLVGAQQLANRDVEAARASYAKASQSTPGDLEALAGLVSIDLGTGRTKDAVGRIEAAQKTMEPTAPFLILAARTYDVAGNPAKAEELLKKAIDTEPASLRAYNELGGLYIRQHRLDDARDEFQQIVQRTPKSTSANTMLGMLFEAQGRLPEAEAQYQKVLGFDARAAVAANNLAWLYAASNRNLDQAVQLAKTALQQLPDDPHVTDTLGWAFYRKGMADSAIPYLESSIQKDATDPTVHYHLGMAYVNTGEIDKARKSLQRALAFKIPFDGADQARKTLSQIGS